MAENHNDGMIVDLWEKLFTTAPKSRKPRNTSRKSSARTASRKMSGSEVRGRLNRIVKRTPEVMVKISSGGKGMRRICAHHSYISRGGKLELEDQDENIFKGRGSLEDIADDWRYGGYPIGEESEKRESFNIVLSMPEGTNPSALKKAASSFARENFEDHLYVMALHTYETDPDKNPSKHPHVHLSVKTQALSGKRLNPRKADIQRWRESFAEKLREHGVEANATRRFERGRIIKSEKTAVYHIDRDYKNGKRTMPSNVTLSREKAAFEEARGIKAKVNPAADNLRKIRQRSIEVYRDVAQELAASPLADDRRLAVQVATFVKQMPNLKTRHELEVTKLQESLQRVNRSNRSEQDKDK